MERGRAAQPSRDQVVVLLDYLENHPGLAKGFSKAPSARDASRRSWEGLALRLNSLGGCIKTWQQWNKYWADKKNFAKKKAALRHRALHGTGGGGQVVELSDIEERILALMGGEQFASGNPELRTSLFQTDPSTESVRLSAPVPSSSLAPPAEFSAGSQESPSILEFNVVPFPPPPIEDSGAASSQSTPSQLGDDTTGSTPPRAVPVVSSPQLAVPVMSTPPRAGPVVSSPQLAVPVVSTPPRAVPVVSTPPRAATSPSTSGVHPPQTPQSRQPRDVRRRLVAPRGRSSQFPTPSRRRRQLSPPPSQRPTQYSRISERFVALEEARIELDRQRIDVDRQRVEADRERIQADRDAERARTQAYRERTEVHRQRLDFERQYARDRLELERRKSSHIRRAEYDS